MTEVALWRHEYASGAARSITTTSVLTRSPRTPRAGIARALGVVFKARHLLNAAGKGNRGAFKWLRPGRAASEFALRCAEVLGQPLALLVLNHRPDLLYQVFAEICATQGRFAATDVARAQCPDPLGGRRIEVLGAEVPAILSAAQIEDGDSDGVVNTRSMLWPAGEGHTHYFVTADHGDVIGHFARREAVPQPPHGRRYWAYDFFPSGAGMDQARFAQVWFRIFSECEGAARQHFEAASLAGATA